ncbi:hypothetical protein [Mesonia sp.]|nr:hypothetical protein [Mesonia sp.]
MSTTTIQTEKKKNDILTVIIASSAGTLIEWYDMFLAIIMASTLSVNFF